MPTKTEAWIVEEAGGPWKLVDVELDDCLEDEVLVE